MRITIFTMGSRGDVQPYIALGAGLQSAGYAVRLATHDEFEPFIRSYGLDFAPVSGNPRLVMQTDDGKAWLESNTNPVRFFTRLRGLAEPIMRDVAHDALVATEDTDVLLASSLGLFMAVPMAEKRRIPLIPAALQPLQTTRHITNSIFPLPPTLMPFRGAYNQVSYDLMRQVMWQVFGSLSNTIRRDSFDLPPTNSHSLLPTATTPTIYGYSEHVLPKPPDWGQNAHITGYWFLDAHTAFQPPADLVDFLAAGAPPVYIGFGSMNSRDPEATADLVLTALRETGQRGVLLTGWGGIGSADLPDTVYSIDSIPHDWLFPQMAAVVHHGGIGTMAAGFRAGVPTITVPFFADQPFWASRAAALGVGPKPIPRPQLTAERLADAIRVAVTDVNVKRRARDLGETIRAENGVARAVEVLDAMIPTLV